MKGGRRVQRSRYTMALVLAFLSCLETTGRSEDVPSVAADHPPSISLSPAVVEVKAKPGQTFSHELTLWNNTLQELQFRMEARDVVVRDGKRVFIPSGEIAGGIARNAMFSEQEVVVKPASFAAVKLTVTIPESPAPRAIACIFMGKTIMGAKNALTMTGSLGTLVTFTLANDFQVESQPLDISVDDDVRSVTFRQRLKNTGSDPVVPKGVVAVTNEKGHLVERLPVSGHRLLPGESLELQAEHAGALQMGKYKVMFLMEHESAFFSNTGEFSIK